ncbi:two-component sensor histidine kinase [Campylobacter insulaenigrae]|uniref:fla regulon two-component system sensor histidine kinase FlgS n=1 Tax=Campylobacter insulaenigrae TaxID=260714 RepID=UPI000F6D6FA8|nr:HAMP domain-containing sensor histidine kinase [Campylobacter insulaenigrae]MCR6591229.1 HAMP domain-containing histidine kinase [Campylobacter insulaenigrae]MCR6592637.1 HAMP domain-containing histidine kinase [Campylobacter insulaenigrae]VEJ53120.1 two-component sensor histidine kinase [Campylobacter insulaenigrae]
MDENILKSLDSNEKEDLQRGLKLLIEQTYVVENAYNQLNENYSALIHTINEIIEVLPMALWVLDTNKNITLQNNLAKQQPELLECIDFQKSHYELEFEHKFYLVKVTSHADKLIISATDISDEKRNERLASMGIVAAHLAHEIRNPIGSISLLSSTLFERSELKNKHIVLEIQKAISRVERIVNSTLLFTKGVHVNLSHFNIKELQEECEQAINSYNYLININFIFDFIDFVIYADKALLALVLQNLIYNAIDAIEEIEEENGEIQIICTKREDKIFIKVYDNGIAIKDKKMVFEAFKTTKLKGNGLGLSLSKQIIEAHNGVLGFEDNPKCFYIELNA